MDAARKLERPKGTEMTPLNQEQDAISALVHPYQYNQYESYHTPMRPAQSQGAHDLPTPTLNTTYLAPVISTRVSWSAQSNPNPGLATQSTSLLLGASSGPGHSYPVVHPSIASSPPPLSHWRSPYVHVRLPATVAYGPNELSIHPILQLGARDRRLQQARWDVLTPPCDGIPGLPGRGVPHYRGRREMIPWYLQPATAPSLRSLTVWTTILDRVIVVHASSSAGVTVYDVLDGIHRAVSGAASNVEQPGDTLGFLAASARHGGDGRLMECGERSVRGRSNDGWIWAGLTTNSTMTETWDLHLV